jgi:hypothetical protein
MFPFQKNGRSGITPIANERIISKLVQKVQSQYVTLTARGTLTLTVAAATAIRNRGSIWAAFSEIGFNADGEDKQIMDPRVLRFLSEMAAPSALTAKRVTSTAVAAYPLEETVRIYFAHPFSAVPKETAGMERDTDVEMHVFAKLDAAGGAARLVNPGPATAVLSALSITVQHGYDPYERARPYFQPIVRQLVDDIVGANDKKEIFVKTSKALRGLIVSQDTTTDGEVADIINKLALIGDGIDIIGPQQVKWDDLVLDSEFEFGGAVVSSNRAHFGLNFQDHGRLSTLLTKAQAPNLRFVADVQPSVAGAGTSRIRTTVIELDRDPAVTDPAIPFPV